MFKDFSEPCPLSLKLVQTVSHNFFQGSETLPWHTYRCLMTVKFGLLSCYLSECAIDNRDVTHSRFSKWQIFEKKNWSRCSGYDFIVFFLSFVVLRFFVSSSFGKFPVTLPFTLLVGLLLLVSCWQKKLPLLVWNWTMNIEPISIKKCFVPLVIQTGTRRRLTENWWDDGIALQVSQIRHLSWSKSLLALNNKISTQEAKRNIDKHLYWYCNLVQSHSVLAHRESYFTLSVLFNPLWFFFSYVSSSSEHKINRYKKGTVLQKVTSIN